jgi:anti-sigma factor RsiW
MTRTNRTDHEHVLALLVGPAEPELTCEQCFDLLDRYVDFELTDPSRTIAGMRAHLEGCPACDEDHESLLAFVTLPPDAGA